MSMVALIAGPTASGKSALALALAQEFGGVIINADSAQIYRDLPILSAAPSATELAVADHSLYGIRDGVDPCSAADWARLAKAAIVEAQMSGRLPILVGGTGLYLRTLLDGIAPVPPIDPEVRQRVRSSSIEDNLTALRKLDPEAAGRLNDRDTARIARALEVVASTGRTLSHWQANREGGIGDQVALKPLVMLPPRPWLYERCDARFQSMISAGAIGEVETLLGRGLDPALPVMRAIGVREIAGHLRGELSFEEMMGLGTQATRNYAKRQYTWFANQPPQRWPRFEKPLDPESMAEALALFEPSA